MLVLWGNENVADFSLLYKTETPEIKVTVMYLKILISNFDLLGTIVPQTIRFIFYLEINKTTHMSTFSLLPHIQETSAYLPWYYLYQCKILFSYLLLISTWLQWYQSSHIVTNQLVHVFISRIKNVAAVIIATGHA